MQGLARTLDPVAASVPSRVLGWVGAAVVLGRQDGHPLHRPSPQLLLPCRFQPCPALQCLHVPLRRPHRRLAAEVAVCCRWPSLATSAHLCICAHPHRLLVVGSWASPALAHRGVVAARCFAPPAISRCSGSTTPCGACMPHTPSPVCGDLVPAAFAMPLSPIHSAHNTPVRWFAGITTGWTTSSFGTTCRRATAWPSALCEGQVRTVRQCVPSTSLFAAEWGCVGV